MGAFEMVVKPEGAFGDVFSQIVAKPEGAFLPIPDLGILSATRGTWELKNCGNLRRQRLCACFVARRALPCFEAVFPADCRPRGAIEAMESLAGIEFTDEARDSVLAAVRLNVVICLDDHFTRVPVSGQLFSSPAAAVNAAGFTAAIDAFEAFENASRWACYAAGACVNNVRRTFPEDFIQEAYEKTEGLIHSNICRWFATPMDIPPSCVTSDVKAIARTVLVEKQWTELTASMMRDALQGEGLSEKHRLLSILKDKHVVNLPATGVFFLEEELA